MRGLLVALMADEPDLEVVAEIEEESEITRVIDETTPEFLIVTLRSPGFSAVQCESLLRRHPHMKILALAKDGNSFIYFSASLGIHATTLECSDTGISSKGYFPNKLSDLMNGVAFRSATMHVLQCSGCVTRGVPTIT
jgi:hypothetical protein